jgi:acetyltransferase
VLPCLETLGLLLDYGIRGARGILARSADDAARWAGQLRAPVAMKVESPDLSHRRRANLVRLDVASADEARACFGELMNEARRAFPGANLRGVLVQEMIRDGIEVMLGLRHDPGSGPVIAAGFREPAGDASRRLSSPGAPLTRADAEAMLRALPGFSLLAHPLDRPPPDLAALVDAVLGLSRLAEEADGAIAALDIHPLLVLPEGRGAIALNAFTVLSEQFGR